MTPVHCPNCSQVQSLDALAGGTPFGCPKCRSQLSVSVFPAIHRSIGPGRAAEAAGLDNESTCFFHSGKKAAVVCDQCGRFLCALCDVPVAGRHLCPKCLESGREKKTITELETSRTSYPSLALTLAILPILIWPLTLVTAPAAVFYAIYGWNKPPSLTGRKRRVALVMAALLGLAQCVGWIFLGSSIYSDLTHG